MTALLLTLADRIRDHWNRILDVNSSWCDLTNEVGIINTLFDEGWCDVDHIVDLFADDEVYENVDYETLKETVQEVAKDFTVAPDLILSNDLERCVELGYDADQVAETAREVGVSEDEVVEFEEFIYDD